MTTLADDARLSEHVYTDTQTTQAPAGWVALTDHRVSNDNGMYAQGYENTNTGEIVIAYRGTTPSDWDDLVAGAELVIPEEDSTGNEDEIKAGDDLVIPQTDYQYDQTGEVSETDLALGLACEESGIVLGDDGDFIRSLAMIEDRDVYTTVDALLANDGEGATFIGLGAAAHGMVSWIFPMNL
jgi:hypothetical protein